MPKQTPLYKNWKKIISLWHHYNLSIILGIMFLSTWTCQFLVQIKQVSNEAQEKGKNFDWHTFWPQFWTSTLENWQSEFLQLLTFVVLTGFLIHKGSPESRDSEERLEKKINQILSILTEKK